MTYPKVLVRSEQSSGRLGVIESVMPPGATGPPLHSRPQAGRRPAAVGAAGDPARHAARAADRRGGLSAR
jgi:hypothetical protein